MEARGYARDKERRGGEFNRHAWRSGGQKIQGCVVVKGHTGVCLGNWHGLILKKDSGAQKNYTKQRYRNLIGPDVNCTLLQSANTFLPAFKRGLQYFGFVLARFVDGR